MKIKELLKKQLDQAQYEYDKVWDVMKDIENPTDEQTAFLIKLSDNLSQADEEYSKAI